MLRVGKKPTLFKSTTNKSYSYSKYMGRAISFQGCVCELDKISESYRVYGAIRPSQYNWATLEIDKETGKRKSSYLPIKTYMKWEKY
jgi:hypothetical protein